MHPPQHGEEPPHALRFGGEASRYHAAAIGGSSTIYVAEDDDYSFRECTTGLEDGGGGAASGNDHRNHHHRRGGSSDTCDSHHTSMSQSHDALYPPLSPQARRTLAASRRRGAATAAGLVLAAAALYGGGYRAGERHGEKTVAAAAASALGVDLDGMDIAGWQQIIGNGPIVADQSLLDGDDDTVETLTEEEAADLDVDEIIQQAQEEAEIEVELALEELPDDEIIDEEEDLPIAMTKFLIFAEQRSGSRFLTDLLNDHPQIACGNEELNRKDTPMNLKHMTIEDYIALLDETYDNVYLDKTKTNSKTTQTSAVGYKIMYNQGPTHYGKDLMARLDGMGIKVIHLIRSNKLLQYISFESNEKDKHLMADRQKAAEEAEELDEKPLLMKHQAHPKTKEEAERIRDELVISGKHPDKILSFIEAREKDDREVSNLVSTYLDADHYAFVDYEDLSDHTEEEMARIFALLGVEERTVRSQMEKIHEGKRTRDYFRKERQEGVKEALKASEFRWMLDGW